MGKKCQYSTFYLGTVGGVYKLEQGLLLILDVDRVVAGQGQPA